MADDDVTNTAAADDDDDVFVRNDDDSGTTYPPRDETRQTRAYRRTVPLSDEFQTQDHDDADADTSQRRPADDTGSQSRPPRDETHSYSSDQRTYSADESISETQPPPPPSPGHTVSSFIIYQNILLSYVLMPQSVAFTEIQ